MAYSWQDDQPFASTSAFAFTPPAKFEDSSCDIDAFLNLSPATSPLSSAEESNMPSSPEPDAAHSPAWELRALDNYDESVSALSPNGIPYDPSAASWEGILRQPVFGLATPSATTDDVATSPSTDASSAHAVTPSSDANAPPTSELMSALLQYNAKYGTLLPSGAVSPAPSPVVVPSALTRRTVPSDTTSSHIYRQEQQADDEFDEDEEDEEHHQDVDAEYHALFGGSNPSSSSSVSVAPPPSSTSLRPTASTASSSTSYSSSTAQRRASGGQAMSSVVIENNEERKEGDEWRPTPEEYKLLSSKQKRQLRNKISARRFRNKRKEQAQQLEEHVTARDRVIEAIRDELTGARSENAELRREIAALKAAVLPSALSSAAFTSTTIAPSQLQPARATSPIPRINRHKDLGSSSASSRGGFWGGSMGGAGGFNQHVHAFHVMPDFPAALLAQKPVQQPNLNPLFNSTLASPSASSTSSPGSSPPASLFPDNPFAKHQELSSFPTATTQQSTFDEFAQANPFALRRETVEAYRTQLWARLAREAAYTHAAHTQQQGQQQHPLVGQLKPAFFRAPTTEWDSSLLSQKHRLAAAQASSSSSSSTPFSPAATLAPTLSEDNDAAHLALLATLAQRTITSRLASAFFEAFTPASSSFPSSSTSTAEGHQHQFDADKVARVLSGRSRVTVVPIDDHPTPSSPAPAAAPAMPSVQTPVLARAAAQHCSASTAHCMDALSEGLRKMFVAPQAKKD